MRNVSPVQCSVQLRVLRPGTFQTAAGKADKPANQLMLEEHSVLSSTYSTPIALHWPPRHWSWIPDSQHSRVWPHGCRMCRALSFSPVWLSVTSWTAAGQAPVSTGILQARILEGVSRSSSRDLAPPRDLAQVSHLAGGFFLVWATREVQEYWSG